MNLGDDKRGESLRVSDEPGHITALMRDPANAVTLAGLGFAVAGLHASVVGEVHLGAACLALALFADMTDGWVARRSGPRRAAHMSRAGMQLDSIADLMHGAILPAALMGALSDWSAISLLLSVLLALCAATRLTYFSVFGGNPDGSYRGVPVIYTSFLTSLLIGLLPMPFAAQVLPWCIATIAVFNVSSLRVPKMTGGGLAAFNLLSVGVVILNLLKSIT
ncbi:CDP-alcohol phosphatidyltransferase family protein [Allorhizobium ampelinum]|uniref:CDP-alcohol phosphatidyltransferase family protein n=1 Tax=Allorhizobium ampelinum TaxID=3025782 RepID=UPI001F2AE534